MKNYGWDYLINPNYFGFRLLCVKIYISLLHITSSSPHFPPGFDQVYCLVLLSKFRVKDKAKPACMYCRSALYLCELRQQFGFFVVMF